MKPRLLFITFTLIIMVSLVGCDIDAQPAASGRGSTEPYADVEENQPQNESDASGSQDDESQLNVSSAVGAALEGESTPDGSDPSNAGNQVSFTPTPDIRLDPEDWRNWPVVPVVSDTAIEIYQNGIAVGQNPQAVSKVGDCQAIKEVLWGIYDQPDRYSFTSEELYLQDTIDNFSGSFNRDGMAVKGGFNAASVLSPMWADPDYCEPGETPLACELRYHSPSIMIISLEVWWEGRTVERYEEYMRRIIEQAIENGVVPVLSTKADNMEGDHSINLVTAQLAYEYDLPLWNFWRAVQNIPHQGIDPERDGFHITTEAWNVRSYTALQVLDAVWRAGQEIPSDTVTVVEVSPTQIPTPIPTVDVSSQISMPPFGEIDLDDGLGTGTIIFDLNIRDEIGTRNMGEYGVDFEEEEYINLTGEGYSLEAGSHEEEQSVPSQGKFYAYLNQNGADPVGIWVAENHQPPGRFLPLPGDHLLDYEWSPAGDQLAVITLVRSNYSGRPSDVRIFLLNPVTWVQREMNPVSGLNALLTWSPDGSKILISSTSQQEPETYGINFWVVDLEKNRSINLGDLIRIVSREYISIDHLEWSS